MTRVSRILQAHSDAQVCRSSQSIIEFVGRRWVGVLLIAGQQGARRFREYRRLAAGISDRVLTARLRELERYDLLERTVIPTVPVQVRYTPTRRGTDLVRALEPLIAWGLREADLTVEANPQLHPSET